MIVCSVESRDRQFILQASIIVNRDDGHMVQYNSTSHNTRSVFPGSIFYALLDMWR